MEIKKKIIVCGDSFCSAHNNERDHFSQILEDEYGYSVVNLARGGIGNISICFQIQTAIQLSADCVIYRRTSSARIEIPVSDKPFDPKLGLKNFMYPFKNESTYGSPHVGNLDAPFFSYQLAQLASTDSKELALQDQFVKLSSDRREAVRMYMTYMYDEQLKQTTDNWAYDYWKSKLSQNNIMTIDFNTVGQIAYDFVAKTNGQYPKCYHTDRSTQEIIAKNIHEKILK